MMSCWSGNALLALTIIASGVRAVWEFPCIGAWAADKVVGPNRVLAGFDDPLVQGGLVVLSLAKDSLGFWHRLADWLHHCAFLVTLELTGEVQCTKPEACLQRRSDFAHYLRSVLVSRCHINASAQRLTNVAVVPRLDPSALSWLLADLANFVAVDTFWDVLASDLVMIIQVAMRRENAHTRRELGIRPHLQLVALWNEHRCDWILEEDRVVFEVVESDHCVLIVPPDLAWKTRAVFAVENGQRTLGTCVIGIQWEVFWRIGT